MKLIEYKNQSVGETACPILPDYDPAITIADALEQYHIDGCGERLNDLYATAIVSRWQVQVLDRDVKFRNKRAWQSKRDEIAARAIEALAKFRIAYGMAHQICA